MLCNEVFIDLLSNHKFLCKKKVLNIDKISIVAGFKKFAHKGWVCRCWLISVGPCSITAKT